MEKVRKKEREGEGGTATIVKSAVLKIWKRNENGRDWPMWNVSFLSGGIMP